MSESVQKKLLRVRPPRVRITYDVHTNGAIEKRELPFIVGIFADLSGDRDADASPAVPPDIKERKIVDIDRDNFNEVLKQSAPRVALKDVDNVLPGGTGKLAGAIVFESLGDFEPIRVVGKVDVLSTEFGRRKVLREAQARAEVSNDAAQVLDEVVRSLEDSSKSLSADDLATKLKSGFPEKGDDFGKDLAAAFNERVAPVIKAAGVQGRGAALYIDAAVGEIDRALSAQLSAVMHAPKFKEMEATWRGLFHLVSRSETGTRLKLRVFNATLKELQDDMDKAVEFDQSKLFKLIYEAEYGTYGGSPYSLLLGGYELGPGASDMSFLEKISGVAASAHAPFLSAASPALFGLKGFADLAKPRDLAKIFEGADLAKWVEFRDTEDSRYVSLALPRVLLRLPYGEKTLPAEGFGFEEQVLAADNVPESDHFLWGNAAYFLAERITNAFSLYSWTAAIRGVEGGGLVEGLPIYTFASGGDDGIKELFCPTEVAITDRREKELNDLGFITLCHCKGSGKAAFFGGQTTNRPKKYINADANANAALSSRLPYILAASRFAHYIKVIVREKVGGFLTRANVETFLNAWISQYVLLDDNASQDVKSAFPLRSASIVVVDVPGEPGAYKATVFLKPHFQLEELTASIRLVADLPA
ncbi:type VI secretion system contractile sheath large subunit [Pseudothauera nasutitermitis]|uniref:Type VI secretion system contractile sheath large subunit n=1 Tax=Pseudothauera nasutitermitis TaxID=2565930 RepID=A0A4S4AYK5_9RHOO|nr:type VI secretion system contractile sheath large subunit [Pseudothauera nasutitermitis]THF63712.1 type VI secretion system contractile sheath large subunit [Pseudothauera nasutitermitis]